MTTDNEIEYYKELAQKNIERKKLLEDEEHSNDMKLTVNVDYAKRFEHNKKREELEKLESKFGHIDSDDSNITSSEDELGDLLTPELDAQLLKTVAKIRSKDSSIYNSNSEFFSEEQMKSIKKEWKNKKTIINDKSLDLKQYHNKMLKEGFIDDDEENEPIYNNRSEIIKEEEEQQGLLDQFHKAVQDQCKDDEELLSKKEKTQQELDKEHEEYKAFLLENLAEEGSAKNTMKRWLQYKGAKSTKAENIEDDEAFLINYVLNRGWIDKNNSERDGSTYFPGFIDLNNDEDDKHLELAEEFEYEYNYRFEQDSASMLVQYPRHIEGSVRKDEHSKRKKRQLAKEKKLEQERKEREDLKRLKNLKREELKKKLEKLKKIAGISKDDVISIKDLKKLVKEDDFFEKYDKKMAEIFNEDYYNQKDHEKEYDQWEKIEEENEDTYPKISVSTVLNELANDAIVEMDYEDKIGDLKTKFKYRQVRPSTYGLDVHDILLSEDKNLNSHVSLKKLYPYISDDVQESNEKKYGKKRRVFRFQQQLIDSGRFSELKPEIKGSR